LCRRSQWQCSSVSLINLTVFFASVLIVIVFNALLPARFRITSPTDYVKVYEPTARNILAGRGIVTPDGALLTWYPPGFPLILAATFWLSDMVRVPETTALLVLNSIGIGLSGVFVTLLARTVWGVGPSVIAGLVWISYPLGLYYSTFPSTEIPYMVFLIGESSYFGMPSLVPPAHGISSFYVDCCVVAPCSFVPSLLASR
jgi:hypothetical protein